MARKSRQSSDTGIYFVYFEAAFGIKLFYDNDDFNIFLNALNYCTGKYNCSVLAYSLNERYAYMLIKESEKTFSLFMRALLSSYALKYNRKYLRNGAITSDRFKSVPITSDTECTSAAVFIHKCAKTDFSSKSEYLENIQGICNKDYILSKVTLSDFIFCHSQKTEFEYIPSHTKKLSDEKILKIILKYTGNASPESIGKLPKIERDKILRCLREKEGLSIGMLERFTGISRSIITRAYNKNKPDNTEIKRKYNKKSIPDTTDYKTRNDVITEKITEKKKEEIWLL